MILVTMGQEDATEVPHPLCYEADIRDDQVDALLVLFRELAASIEKNEIAATFHRRHVLTYFAHTSKRNHANRVVSNRSDNGVTNLGALAAGTLRRGTAIWSLVVSTWSTRRTTTLALNDTMITVWVMLLSLRVTALLILLLTVTTAALLPLPSTRTCTLWLWLTLLTASTLLAALTLLLSLGRLLLIATGLLGWLLLPVRWTAPALSAPFLAASTLVLALLARFLVVIGGT